MDVPRREIRYEDWFFFELKYERWVARRMEQDNVDQEVPLNVLAQAPSQAPINPLNENIANLEFRSAFQVFSQAVKAEDNR
uniref:Uncharacterized protein n=1 Tax=Solanum tuberosum TaxID=4113 RepID=M1DGF6_SOLTU